MLSLKILLFPSRFSSPFSSFLISPECVTILEGISCHLHFLEESPRSAGVVEWDSRKHGSKELKLIAVKLGFRRFYTAFKELRFQRWLSIFNILMSF